MLSKTQFIVMVIGAAALGCGVNDDPKIACITTSDCLDGYTCVNLVCSRGGDGPDGDGPDGDGPDDDGPDGSGDGSSDPNPDAQFGDLEPLAPQTIGLAVPGDFVGTLLGAASTGGNFGCALVGDQASSPGGAAALVYAKLSAGGDRRCPTGSHAIINSPDTCNDVFSGIRPQCAIYKRWNASGTLVAQRLAIGGFVSVDDVVHSEMSHTCNVEATVVFSGRSIDLAFSFDFNPFAPSNAFCVH